MNFWTRYWIMTTLLVAALTFMSADTQASIGGAQRSATKYVQRLQQDYRPRGVHWNASWATNCFREAEFVTCGYGIDGTRADGRAWHCSGAVDVYRRRRGQAWGWPRKIAPVDVVRGKRYELWPNLSFNCYGPESGIIRIGTHGEVLDD
jgi:hypothetical protein